MFESKYLEFNQIGWTGKTGIWNVLSKTQGSVLGQIKWFGRWRQYCFWPSPDTIFNPECLEHISKAIKKLTTRRNQKMAMKCNCCGKNNINDDVTEE